MCKETEKFYTFKKQIKLNWIRYIWIHSLQILNKIFFLPKQKENSVIYNGMLQILFYHPEVEFTFS